MRSSRHSLAIALLAVFALTSLVVAQGGGGIVGTGPRVQGSAPGPVSARAAQGQPSIPPHGTLPP